MKKLKLHALLSEICSFFKNQQICYPFVHQRHYFYTQTKPTHVQGYSLINIISKYGVIYLFNKQYKSSRIE